MYEAEEEMPDLAESRRRMQELFSGPAESHGGRWAELWDQGDFLPWDRGTPNPALEDALRSEVFERPKPEGRRPQALVPGCGRGYDVLLLASFGYDAWGLEVSASAVERCEEEKAKYWTRASDKYPVQEEGGEATFVVGDFFDYAWPIKFDLVYDYTVG